MLDSNVLCNLLGDWSQWLTNPVASEWIYEVLPSQPGRRRASCTYVTGIKETKDGESYLQVTGSDMDAAMVLLRLWRFVENDIL